MENYWHIKTADDVMKEFSSGEHGLGENEAARRLKEIGPNKLPESKGDSLTIIFFRQFQSPLIYILLIASVIVFLLREISDGLIILFVLLFNAVAGTFQEGKAQNILLALKNFSATEGVVVRGGRELIISDSEIVPGDIIVLQEGQKVPADARVVSSNNLKVEEAALTGESIPAHKVSIELPVSSEKIPLSDQKNIVFKGTNVVSGNGKAVVTATGLDTAIGKISKEIAAIDTEIPLKTDIRYLSKLIIYVVIIAVSLLFLIGLSFGNSLKEMFTMAVSVSVSVIPEGLPVVMTLVLAQGVWRMGKRNALVKKLQAVGSIGQVKVIAADKTGTLTKNEMMVKQVYLNNRFFEVSGAGYEPQGDIALLPSGGKNDISLTPVSPPDFPEIVLAGRVASFCSDARVARYEEVKTPELFDPRDDSKKWHVSGDPTDASLLVFSQKVGFEKSDLLLQHPVIEEVPFDYRAKYHAVVNMVDNRPFLSVIGAPETILGLSKTIWQRDPRGQDYAFGRHDVLSDDKKNELDDVFIKMSGQGLRVLAFAIKYPASSHISPKESSGINDLTFVGFFGIKDTLRVEARETVKRAFSAGIKVVMITGDHKITAKAIGIESGIFNEGDEVITGQELDALSDLELLSKLPKISIFARVTPAHKLRIVRAYKSNGDIVAMTGDGVNDAPSLVAADIGVAMGNIGTEVAKEASDIILLDDNFSTIISAVEEGRNIFKTIRKVLLYLFSTNAGEILAIGGALISALPLPVLPSQIIWLNLVTDGFLVLALSVEPKENDLLMRPFEKQGKYLIDRLMAKRIIIMAVTMMIGTLIVFRYNLFDGLLKAQTAALTALVVFQWFNAWNCRHAIRSAFGKGFFSNKLLTLAAFTVIGLQMLAIYHPLLQKVLHTVPLNLDDWLFIIPIAFSIIIVEEIRKLIYRWSHS